MITNLAQDVFGRADLAAATEFHAADIVHRKKNFKQWTDFKQRVDVIRGLARILSEPTVHLIRIQINCDRLWGGQAADEIAFMFLCERASDLMRSKGSLGMLIGDRESDQLASRFATTLSTYRATGTDLRLAGTSITLWIPFTSPIRT
jgi:hypothetical protein